MIASDVADMRRAIAQEKGEDDIWDLKYAAGGIVDIDFIAQYLQLVHAAEKPDILDVATLQVLDNAARLGVLPQSDAEVLRPAARLYHDLTQIIRLCVSGKFNPETAGEDLLRVMARAGDAPDFSSLEARVRETQTEVRRVFFEVVEGGNIATCRRLWLWLPAQALQIRFVVLSPTTRRSIVPIRSERSASAALMASVVCCNVLTFDPSDTIAPSITAIDPRAAT